MRILVALRVFEETEPETYLAGPVAKLLANVPALGGGHRFMFVVFWTKPLIFSLMETLTGSI